MTADRKAGFPSVENPFYDPKFEKAVHPNFNPTADEIARAAQNKTRFQQPAAESIARQRITSGFDMYGIPDPKFMRPSRFR